MTASLRPQDLVVACKLVSIGKKTWTYAWLMKELSLSTSGTFNAIARLRKAGLVQGGLRTEGSEVRVVRKRLFDLLASGAIQAMFFPVKGEITRGVPTSVHAPPLKNLASSLVGVSDDLVPLVWPYSKGIVRGETLRPIHPSAIHASLTDVGLYELLALIDVLRVGKAKERKAALGMLETKILIEENGRSDLEKAPETSEKGSTDG
jgi:hypothetical protein